MRLPFQDILGQEKKNEGSLGSSDDLMDVDETPTLGYWTGIINTSLVLPAFF
jgi:hypothetical protein